MVCYLISELCQAFRLANKQMTCAQGAPTVADERDYHRYGVISESSARR